MYGRENAFGSRRVLQWAATAALALAALLLAAQPAAAADPIKGGETKIDPTKKAAKALKKAKKGKVKVKPKKLEFPVTGGEVEAGQPSGTVEHKGSKITFTQKQKKKGKKSSASKSKTVKVTAKNPLIDLDKGRVNVDLKGSSLRLFDLAYTGKTSISRGEGFSTMYEKVTVNWSKAGAKAFKKSFGVKAKGGQKFGTAMVTVEPESVELIGGTTTLDVPDATLAAIGGAGIAPSPIAPATIGADGLVFPITGGRVDAEDLSGAINHSGGLKLASALPRVVDLTDFEVQIDADPSLFAQASVDGGAAAPLEGLTLDLSGASIAIDGTDITVDGVQANLTPLAAGTLNTLFSTTVFTTSLDFGIAKVEAEAN